MEIEMQEQRPIDLLVPGSDAHQKVLDLLLERLQASEKAMSSFYDRWEANERRMQAYINLPDYEKLMKQMNDSGEPPKVTSIVMPHAFATISTIVTYMIHVFAGRKPMFPVGAYKRESAQSARLMETMLQFNSEHVRLLKHLFQFLTDGELYGLGVLRTQWQNETKNRTVWKTQPKTVMGIPVGMEKVKTREQRVVFQGTHVKSIDPFNFFPDPRVPIADVNKDGEFVFWRTFEGKMVLKGAQAKGQLAHVDAIPDTLADSKTVSNSMRGLLSKGEAHPGRDLNDHSLSNFYQIDQGTVDIIPSEWGLGQSQEPERWIFAIANKKQVIQAEPFDADHSMHPVVVSEPYTLGYGFGQPGLSDFLGPVQDATSWFLNSHIHNVRAALNNMLIVDPSMVEMQDLKNPKPGGFIRLKKAAFGRDPKTVLQQLQISDITRSHVNDLELVMRIGDSLSAINDNLRGVQDSGGRKTATEVRTSGEAAASRLAAHTKLISAQAFSDLTEQMSVNMQQNLTEEFYLEVVGEQGRETPIHIVPEALVGDFTYPISDGTLPLDKVAMLDVWKELFLGIAQDQELRMAYNVPAIFEYIAELGGAQNISKFRLDIEPGQPAGPGPQQGVDPVQAGNAVPMQDALSGLGHGPAGRATGGMM